jgi:hypothetical protein
MGKTTSAHAAFVTSPHLKSYGGMALTMGQVFVMQGLRNDDALLRRNYVRPIGENYETLECAFCPAEFAHDQGITNHMRNLHDSATPNREPNALEAESPPVPSLEQMIPPQRQDIGRVGVAVSAPEE